MRAGAGRLRPGAAGTLDPRRGGLRERLRGAGTVLMSGDKEMKTTLLAGTALVAAGLVVAAGQAAAAEKITLGFGGFMEQWIGYVDEDNDGANGVTGQVNVDQKSDSEWFIQGSTKLDNGISVSVKWEVEGEPQNVGQASFYDEGPTASISGSFGRIDLGRNDVASENLVYGASSVGAVGINKTDMAGDWVRTPANGNSATTTHNMDIGMDDEHMITYYTPRIAGFQLGASYVPNIGGGATQGEQPNAETAVGHNGVSLGANWVGKLGEFGVALSAGYAFAEDLDNNAGSQGEDRDGYSFGGRVTFGAFGLHVGYLVERDVGTQVGDDETLDASVTYTMGANKLSLGGMWAEGSAATVAAPAAGDDKFTMYELGYTRVLGPGVDWASSLAWVEFDGVGSGGAADNEGWVAVTGLRLSF